MVSVGMVAPAAELVLLLLFCVCSWLCAGLVKLSAQAGGRECGRRYCSDEKQEIRMRKPPREWLSS